jgi:hypothetical protein
MHGIIGHSKPAVRNPFKKSQKQGHAGEGEDVPKQTNLRPENYVPVLHDSPSVLKF